MGGREGGINRWVDCFLFLDVFKKKKTEKKKKIEACLSAIVIALNDHKPVSLEQGGTWRLKEGGNEQLST